jgi:hypothetical protein
MSINISPQDLDPNVVRLACLVGLLTRDAEDTGGMLTLQTDWFNNPLDHLREIPARRGAELVQLLESLLGSVAGNALGTPTNTLNRSWYPIRNPGAEANESFGPQHAPGASGSPTANVVTGATGLYLVTYETEEASPAGESRIVVGLGLMRSFVSGSLTFTVYAYFPLLALPAGDEGYFVLGQSDDPAELGFEITGGGAAFGSGDVSFDGLKVAMEVFFNGDAPRPEIVLLNLRLPGQPKPADVSLLDLIANGPINKWISLGLSVLAARLAASPLMNSPAGSIEAMVYDLMALLGLIGDVPSFDWQGLSENPSDITVLLNDWIKAIASSPEFLKSWLASLRDALAQGATVPLNSSSSVEAVSGNGTRADPWAIQLVQLGDETALSFTVASVTETNGNLSLYPGVRVESKLFQPVSGLSRLGVRGVASIELVRMTLPAQGTPTSALFPLFELGVSILNPLGGPLFTLDDPLPANASDADLAAPIESGVVKPDGFSIDAMAFALSYSGLSTGGVPAPTFTFTNVNTALGSWSEITLADFDNPVQLVENLLTTLVQNALNNFLGTGGGVAADEYAQSLAVVLGLSAPAAYVGTWPVDEMLINTPAALDALVANPLGALGGYYARCMATTDPLGQPVWKYLVQYLCQLLGGEASVPVGSGDVKDPWQVPLISLGEGRPGAYLRAWQAESSPVAQPELHLALYFGVPLNIPIHSSRLDHAVASVGLLVELLSLNLPDGDASFGADWLRSVSLEMLVTGAAADNTQTPLATPALAGLSLQAQDIMVAAGWRREDGFYWETEIAQAVVGYTQTGTQQPIGTISFSSANSPENESGVSALAQVFVSTAGLWLLEHGGRFGLTLTGALGLLPALPSLINGAPGNYPFELPRGLALPANWPVLNLSDPGTFFTQPWGDLKSQLGQLFSDGALAEPLLRLLAWAIAGEVPAMPAPLPGGTADDPWSAEFPNLRGLELLAWSESTSSGAVTPANASSGPANVSDGTANAMPAALGFGLRKTVSSGSGSDVQLDAAIRLDIARLCLNGSGASDVVSLPRCLLTCDFTNPAAGQPLVQDVQSGLRIGSARCGVQFDSEGVTPLLVLYDAQLTGSDAPQTFELTRASGQLPILTCEQGIEALETLLNELMGRLIDESDALPSVQAMFGVLEVLGLTQTQVVNGSPVTVAFEGISMGAWDGMLANPAAFFNAQVGTLAQDSVRRNALFEHLSALFGFSEPQLPQALSGLPALLASLGLLQQVTGGYAVSLSSWLGLIRQPVQYLEREASGLLNSADARQQLITALKQAADGSAPAFFSSPPSAALALEVTGGTKVTLKLSEPINLGPELALSGDLVLDLQALSLDASIVCASSETGSALGFHYEMLIGPNGVPVGPDGQAGGDWHFALEAAPGPTPAPFAPLRIYPLPSDTTSYLVQLAEEVPLFLLSAVAGKVLNQYVLPGHPLAVNLFDIFGLAFEGPDGTQHIRSLLGIFMHPVDWLLSEQVLGDANQRLDLNKLGQLLKRAAGSGINGPDGVTLIPNETGLTLSGLPYGMEVALKSDGTAGVSINLGIEPLLAPPAPSVKVDAGLSFGTGAGVSVDGGLTLIFDLAAGASPVASGSPPATDQLLTVNASYNEEEKNAFALSLIARTGGTNYPLTLLPFQGLNQFIPGAGGTQALLGFLAGKLNDAYTNNQAKMSANYPDLEALIESFISIGNDFGITDAASLLAAAAELRSNPLKWLLGPLAPGKVSGTLDSINTILSERLKLPGFSRVEDANYNAIRYTPDLTSPAGETSLAINFGNRVKGNDTFFGMWATPQVCQEWLRVAADTGIGITLPLSGNVRDASFDFTLETGIGIDLRSLNIPLLANGPQLSLYLDIESAGAPAYRLKFFPFGDPAVGGSTIAGEILYLDLLPTPVFTIESRASPQGPADHDALHWLRQFTVHFLLPLIADIALDTDAVKGFLDQSIGALNNGSTASAVTPGIILRNWGLLAEKNAPASPLAYVLADWTAAFSGTPTEVIQNLILAALSSFPADFPLLEIHNGSGIYIVSEANDVGGTDYGLRLQVTDLPLGSASAANGQAKNGGTGGGQTSNAAPQFLLQLGNWQTGEDISNPWIKRADPGWPGEPPGVTFYLLRLKQSNAAGQPLTNAFYPKLKLTSVGVDVKATGNAPLVNLKGFRLSGFEPRLYLSLDPENLDRTIFGASIRCDEIGIPLGPNFGSSTNSNNPVAQNLLASKSGAGESGGGDAGAGGGAEGQSAVNPIFSMTASYVRQFDFVLHGGQDGDPSGIIWFPVQRSFGPLTCRKIGIGWQGAEAQPPDLLSVAFDGDVSLAGLSVDLMNLTVGVPVRTPTDFDSYVLDLGGINISFAGGPVEISGGLLKSYTSTGELEYTGSALVKAATFLLSGMGSYAVLDHQPSLFIFVVLNTPLGGPAFFFVTGVCAGFGYNRSLILPAQDKVQSFPLVAGITDPGVFGGQDPLRVLNEDVPPTLGAYWLAAGVQFTSFDLIHSSALLVVEFGREFEIALLGLSTLVLPKTGDGVNPYVYAELSIQVVFKPSTGLLAATMVLTPNSYVLDKDCKLTGGFAFYVWFSGPHKGEFVVTLGGYHPMFTPPDYYPLEPRLGFNWPVSGDVLIKGEAYFALTPSCVMAGGKLEATYQSGNLHAWFDAQADFLISWKPFHYDISISISIGASYTIRFIISKTFTVELGASVHIWGPRMRGTAHIKWYIISFTVSFGSGDDYSPQSSTIANWGEFDSYFLKPQHVSAQQLQLSPQRVRASGVADAADVSEALPSQVVCTIRVAAGLLGQYTDASNRIVWIIRADAFVLATQTSIPATQIIFKSGPDPTKQSAALPADPAQILPVGVRPMNQPTIVTQHIISITKQSEYSDLVNGWTWQAETGAVPAALWDHDANNGNLSPDAKVLPGRMIGIGSGMKKEYVPPTPPPPIDILTAFRYVPLAHRLLPLSDWSPAYNPPVQDDAATEIVQNTIMDPLVSDYRASILDAVVGFGYDVRRGGRLDILAASAQTTFWSPPMLGSLDIGEKTAEVTPGRTVNLSQRSRDRLKGANAPPRKLAGSAGPRLRALIRQHALSLSFASGQRAGEATRTGTLLRTTVAVSGKVHSANLYATRQDLQSLAGVAGEIESFDESRRHRMSLHAGATLLWEVAAQSEARTSLRMAGSLPVRAVSFDRYHGLLADVVLGADEMSAYELPQGAAHLSLTALDPGDGRVTGAPVVGWHSHSSLLQVTHKAFLGEGAVIIPQAAQWIPASRRLSRVGRKVDHGLVTGRELSARNIVKVGPSEQRRGWIETLMPASVRVIVLLFTPGAGQAQASAGSDLAASLGVTVRLLEEDGDGTRVEYRSLDPYEIVALEKESCALLTVPHPELQAAQRFLRVRVSAPEGWTHEGVLGISEGDVQEVRSGLSELRLEPRGVSLAGTQDLRAMIEMETTLQGSPGGI